MQLLALVVTSKFIRIMARAAHAWEMGAQELLSTQDNALLNVQSLADIETYVKRQQKERSFALHPGILMQQQ